MNISRKLSGTLVVSTQSQLLFSMDNQRFLPLVEMARHQAPNQVPQFIVRYFDTPVSFEAGATLSNFLLALEPWQEILSLYTDRDIGAYIAACRKPMEVSPIKDDDISKIVVSSVVDIRRQVLHHHGKKMDEYDSMEEYFNAPVTTEVTPLLTVEHVFHASGWARNDPDTPYSLMGEFSTICHLPIEIKPTYRVQSVSDNENPLNPDALGAEVSYGGKCVGFEGDFADNRLTFREVVEAVIVNGLFFATPHGMERFNKKLQEDLNDDRHKKQDSPHLKLVKEDKDDNKEENGQTTIRIQEGAFDDMFAAVDHDHAVWEELLRRGSLVRIGTMDIN